MLKNSQWILIFFLSLFPVSDTDLGWHMRTGEYIYNFHEVPQNFLFSFTNGETYTHYSWAAELLMYCFYKVWGLWGISFFYGIILTASVLIIAKTCLLFSSNKVFLPYFIAITPFAHVIAGGRTIVFGLFFLSLVYFLLVKFQKHGTSGVWLIPAVFLFWANFHASFVLGILILIFFFVYYLVKQKFNNGIVFKLLLIIVLSLLATLVNPYFTKVWIHTIFTTAKEFFSLKIINPGWVSPLSIGPGMVYIFIAISISVLIQFSRRVDLSQKVLVFSLFTLTLFTLRFLFGFIIVLAPALYPFILEVKNRLNSQIKRSIQIKVAVISFFSIIILLVISNFAEMNLAYSSFNGYVYYLSMHSPNKKLYKDWSNEGYLFFEKNLKNKNVLTDANWGGLFILDEPQAKVFYYGALDNLVVDGKPFPFEYFAIVNALDNWQDKLDKYKVEVVFLPSAYPVVEKLKHNSNWETAFEDKSSTILVKN